MLQKKQKLIKEIREATKEDMDKAYSEISNTRLKDVQRIPLIGKYNPDFNAWQNFQVRYLTKLAIDEGYNGIKLVGPELQAERISNILSDNFDGLYYLSSVNPHDVQPVTEWGNQGPGFLHTPSNQFISNQTLMDRPDLFTAADAFQSHIVDRQAPAETAEEKYMASFQQGEIIEEEAGVFRGGETQPAFTSEQQIYEAYPDRGLTSEDYKIQQRELEKLKASQLKAEQSKEKKPERKRIL